MFRVECDVFVYANEMEFVFLFYREYVYRWTVGTVLHSFLFSMIDLFSPIYEYCNIREVSNTRIYLALDGAGNAINHFQLMIAIPCARAKSFCYFLLPAFCTEKPSLGRKYRHRESRVESRESTEWKMRKPECQRTDKKKSKNELSSNLCAKKNIITT